MKARSIRSARANRKRADSPQAHIPSRWRWHYQTLAAVKNRLIEESREHLSEVAEPIELSNLGMADAATDEFDHELAVRQLSAESDALYEVEAAMKRIVDGTYGICEQTHKPIPAARLKAIPWTRFRKEVVDGIESQSATAHSESAMAPGLEREATDA